MNAYKIETERLIIRCYEPKDAQKLKLAIDESIEHLSPWMPWAKNEPETIEQKVKRLRIFRGQFDLDQDYTYGIFDKEENILIGSTGLHTRQGIDALEIGYWIRSSQMNNGFALESTQALTKVAFEIVEIQRVEIHCDIKNIRNYNIPKKIGYKLNEVHTIDSEKIKDNMIWTMDKEDYEKSNSKNINLKVYDSQNEKIL